MTRVPMVNLPIELNKVIEKYQVSPLNLYRCLSHNPPLLGAWLEFANILRQDSEVSRQIRELMILRGAQICHSEYEWHQHRPMALRAGVTEAQIEALSKWKDSSIFSKEECAVLRFMEAIIEGVVDDEVDADLNQFFTHRQKISLILTASFYAMVPRVLEALRVPTEGQV
jgi:alkylhydroperoxidase family enzyme